MGNCAEGNYDPTNGAMLLVSWKAKKPRTARPAMDRRAFKLFGSVEMMPTGGLPAPGR